MLFNFRFFLLIFCLQTFVLSMPYCETIADTINQFFILNSEYQRLDISKYFRGYNLSFEVESEDKNYKLLPPINFTIEYPINNLSQNQKHIAIDVLSDNQYQYKQQGVLLSKNNNGSIFVRFGDLDQLNGVNFSSKIQYIHSQQLNCFDILSLGYNIALIDCQKVNDVNNTDVILIVDGTNITVGTQKHNNIITQNRKILNYRVQNKTFVLSIMLSDFIDNVTLKNQSYINIYVFNHTLKSVQFLMVIDWNTLGNQELTIADIDIDPFGFVYLADNSDSQDYLIYRFKINDDATIMGLADFNLNQKPAKLSTVLLNNDFFIQVATNDSIIQIEWNDKPRLISSYELPQDIGYIQDVQMNEEVIMIQSESGYYFYNLRQYKLRQLLHHFQLKDGIVLLDKINNYGVFVTHNKSITIMISSGNLVIGKANQQKQQKIENSSMIFKAISGNLTNKKICQIVLNMNFIFDVSEIQVIKQPPIMFTIENPANFTLHMQNYYSGSLMSYQPKSMSNVKYNKNFINSFSFFPNLTIYEPLGTFQIDQQFFFRAIKTFDQIVLEICRFDYLNQTMTCEIDYKIQQQGDILAFFFLQVRDQNTIIFGYSSSNSKSTINFYDISSGSIFQQPITFYNNTVPITSLTVSDLNIIITFKQHDRIFLYKIANKQIKYFMDIDVYSFPSSLVQQISIFRPSKVKSSHPRLIYILNGKHIIIMRLTSVDATYISNIELPISENVTNVDFKIYQKILTILVGQLGLLMNYHMGNAYIPLLIQTHYLNLNTIIEPLSLYNHIDNPYTIFSSINQNSRIIHLFKSGVSSISAYYFKKQLQKNINVMSAIVFNTLLLFGSYQQQSFNFRVFNQPTITITTESAWELFKTYRPYGIITKSLDSSKEIIFLGTLRVVNYQTIIKSAQSQRHHIYFPRKSQQDLIILPKSLFTGSVTSYQIKCSQCSDQISLIPYIYSVAQLQTIQNEPSNQYIYFKQNLNIIWILSNTYIKIVNQNLQQVSSPLKICSNCICSNFVQINSGFFVVICSQQNSHQFFTIIKSVNQIDLKIIRTFVLPNSFVIENCYQMKVVKNWLFILDNNLQGKGKGQIRVFRLVIVLDDILSIQQHTILDYSIFGVEQDTHIFDFDIISLQNYLDGKYFAMLVTLGEKGIGYICYDSDQQIFSIINKKGNYIDLNKNTQIGSFILDNNQYRQVKVINIEYQNETINKKQQTYINITTSLIISSTYGCHLELIINFELNNTFQYTNISISNTFYKYGNQKVLNWMAIINQNEQKHLAIAHYNESTSICSLTIYPLQDSHQSINFKGSISVSLFKDQIILTAIMIPFSQQSLLVYDSNTQNNVLYNINTQEMFLLLNYNNISIQQITIIASNDYSFAVSTIDITTQEIIPNSNKTIIYVILGIFILILLLGVAYGIIRFILKNKNKKQCKQSLIDSKLKDQIIPISRKRSINNDD